MTDLHPLTEEIWAQIEPTLYTSLEPDISEIDQIVRARLDPKPIVVESGVRFTGMEDTSIEVAGTFIESGNQMQMAIIGTEPVLLVQPNFDAEENHITLIVTAVDLPPRGLVETLKVLLDGAETIVAQQGQMESVREDDDVFDPIHRLLAGEDVDPDSVD